jgi:hypothetical protein
MSSIIVALTAVMIPAYTMVANGFARVIAGLPIGAAITARVAGVVRTAMAASAPAIATTMTTPISTAVTTTAFLRVCRIDDR